MFSVFSIATTRIRILMARILSRLGIREDGFLLVLAILIGVITAAAAVAFHELINWIRDFLYNSLPSDFLYGKGILLLILLPSMGGLIVAVISRYITRTREGHGVVDVIESVIRAQGFVRPGAAVEKIITSAITIGSGGSAGAEGPIVQIGAAIASGVGRLFHIARQHMPILIGCGSAAGISAIFNAPIGGVLFTLEVVLYDFSIRTFAPVVLASVIANVTTQTIFRQALGEHYVAIFHLPAQVLSDSGATISWSLLPTFVLLGLFCGLVGVSLTRLMYFVEQWFSRSSIPKILRPTLGGALLGLIGVAYILIFGWWMLGKSKPFSFADYPMPAFFGDGYGVIRQFLDPAFYAQIKFTPLLGLFLFLLVAKVLGTCLTLSSGGSGGVIAPSLFIGAVTGGLLGIVLRQTGLFPDLQPSLYALIGMGAVLAAVVHAPLASILILLDLTHDYQIFLPAMVTTVLATGLARLIFQDSVYTFSLRLRGVHVGSSADHSLLRKITIEQVPLEPAITIQRNEPFQNLLNLILDFQATDFVVIDKNGKYLGMVTAEEINTALLQREAVPLLVVGEVMRPEIPILQNTDDLATAMETFARNDVGRLPICVNKSTGHVIGLISRVSLMKRYHQALAEG